MESSDDQIILQQLTALFNSIFGKQSLRKNTYLFNAMNRHMQISLKTIAKERRVFNITKDMHTLVKALKLCPLVEILSTNTLKILVKGDQVIVRVKSSETNKLTKKQINSLTKQIKCEHKQAKDSFLIEFYSHAAALQFIERIKALNKNYDYELLQKHPYECIQKSINNLRKDKKQQGMSKSIQNQPYLQYYYPQQYYPHLANYYPLFIRKAVDSDSEQQHQKFKSHDNIKKYIEKQKIQSQSQSQSLRPRISSEEFSSCQFNQKREEKIK